MSNSNGVDETDEPDHFFYCRKNKIKDVKDALSKMKKRKAIGPDYILIKVHWQYQSHMVDKAL